MRNFQVLSDELVLRADVVVEGDLGKGPEVGGVGGGGGLAVTEEGGDYDEVFGGIEGFVGADEPDVLGNYLRMVSLLK